MNRSVCVLTALAAMSATAPAGAQAFAPLAGAPDPPGAFSIPGPRPQRGAFVVLDAAALELLLAQAPAHRPDAPLAAYGLEVNLPGPTGEVVPCFVAEAPVMAPELAVRYPGIRTYIVRSRDGSASGRIEVSPRGLTGMLRELSGDVWMIDPAWSGDPSVLVSYHLADLPGGGSWSCETDPAVHAPHDPPGPRPASAEGVGGDNTPGAPESLQQLRTVRAAIACTGEYGLHHSTIQGHAPNAADPLAAIVTVVARANVVFEADVAVRLVLVPDEDRVIYFDPATDPFPTTCDGAGGANCSSPILGVVSSVISSRIAPPYDLAHCVTRIAGGVAYLNDICRNSGGVSGIPCGGDVDPLSALMTIHEMGHQFGANHSFSGTLGRCAGNINLATAWEAGSGSTPMAYPGACPVGDGPPTDNVARFADPFYHHGSLAEMRAFLPTAACLVPVTTANNLPEIVGVTPDSPIPPRTPFTLTAAATDPDGDPLTYSWEQFDAGQARPLTGAGSQDNGRGALFRAFPPTAANSRTFPRMADVLSGVPTPGERLPEVVGFDRTFRAIVRDNRPGGGGTATSALVRLRVAGTGPFAVVSPVENQQLIAGPCTVTWSRGGTEAAPISCSSVSIRLSVDGGATFPIALGSFPNTGSAVVAMPELHSPAARARIDGVDKIFFAVSRPFRLQRSCPPDLAADGFLDFFDVDAFLAAFESGSPDADFNDDGFIDFLDLAAFIAAFEAGC